jgi:hypothetical protein
MDNNDFISLYVTIWRTSTKLAQQAGYSGYASYILEVTSLNVGGDTVHPDDFFFNVSGKWRGYCNSIR